MKFKVDENLPAEVAADLVTAGNDAQTVADEGMAGASDGDLLEVARRERRVLLTLDKGIANIHLYPPASLAGVVLFRPDSAGRGAVLGFVREHLSKILQLEPEGRLIVVTGRGIRRR